MSFFKQYCILSKNDSLLPILRFPGYFETPLFRTFFHFPWDFEIAGFNCTHNWWMDFFPRAHALSDFILITDEWIFSQERMLSLTSSRSQTMKLFPAKISGHVAMCSRPPKNMKLGGFTSQSCKTAKKHTKKRACTCNAVFFSNLNLLHFSPSHCPRRCRCCLSCLLFRWPIDFRNQNYLFPLVPWDQVSIHHLWNEVEIGRVEFRNDFWDR